MNKQYGNGLPLLLSIIKLTSLYMKFPQWKYVRKIYILKSFSYYISDCTEVRNYNIKYSFLVLCCFHISTTRKGILCVFMFYLDQARISLRHTNFHLLYIMFMTFSNYSIRQVSGTVN